MLAGGAGRALAESSVHNTVTPNWTDFAVRDSSAARVGVELSCGAGNTLGVVLGTVVFTNRAHFASPSSGCLARTNSASHVGNAASVVSVGPCSTSTGCAGGFTGGRGVCGASARRAYTRRFILSWRAVHATAGTERSSRSALALLASLATIIRVITCVTNRTARVRVFIAIEGAFATSVQIGPLDWSVGGGVGRRARIIDSDGCIF
mmetsp:Transcript_17489/g.36160  ORF Transcript_17489/g.36160 Transcript_17489/m.36160 type:complete len:207 (-) Transcript_17489:60-680(-)